MRKLSTEELVSLGERFNIEVGDDEADAVREMANVKLEPLEQVMELPLVTESVDVGERSWWEPDKSEKRNNAILTWCEVPPTTTNNDDLLAGQTVGVKDNIAVAGVPMTCASETMEGFTPKVDAPPIHRLRTHGATITAKTNLDEYANPGHGINGWRGQISNPHDSERTAGGSSGGSAAAVANGQVDLALGTDTGGSVRIPASYCGVVGLKPSYGIVPNMGVVENTYTQDHVGVHSTTVREAVEVLEAIAGKHENDPASLQAAGRDEYRVGGYISAIEDAPPVTDIEVVVLKNGFEGPTSDEVVEQTRSAIDSLSDAGAAIREATIEHYDNAKAIKNNITHVENAAHWRAGAAPYRRGGVVDVGYQSTFSQRSRAASRELNPRFKARLLAGAQVIDAHDGRPYTRALAARELLQSEFKTALDDADALLTPTMPTVAPLLNECPPSYDYPRNTRHANVIRAPAITLPSGDVGGLPVGLHLMANEFDDAALFSVAATVEASLED
jgi:amidase/aspartyl-tRNA(Asn)/glutamyl-tRNA(Gln) amidotransferase subunit A